MYGSVGQRFCLPETGRPPEAAASVSSLFLRGRDLWVALSGVILVDIGPSDADTRCLDRIVPPICAIQIRQRAAISVAAGLARFTDKRMSESPRPHHPLDLSFAHRLGPVAVGLLDHSADPCTDRGIKAATGTRLARHQMMPVLRRVRLGA